MTNEQVQFWLNQGLAILAWVVFAIFLYRQGWPFIRDRIIDMQVSFAKEMEDRKAEITQLLSVNQTLTANNGAQRDAHLAAERQSRADFLAALDTIRAKQDTFLSGELKELRLAITENTHTMHDFLSNIQAWDGETERRKRERKP